MGEARRARQKIINPALHREGLDAQVLSCRNGHKVYKLGCGIGVGIKTRGSSGTTTEILLRNSVWIPVSVTYPSDHHRSS